MSLEQGSQPRSPLQRFLSRPGSRLGWWAAVLAGIFIALYFISAAFFWNATATAPWQQAVLPFYGIGMLLVGLAGGIVGLIAVIRRGERSWLVWLAILPALMALFLLLGEFLVPH